MGPKNKFPAVFYHIQTAFLRLQPAAPEKQLDEITSAATYKVDLPDGSKAIELRIGKTSVYMSAEAARQLGKMLQEAAIICNKQ